MVEMGHKDTGFPIETLGPSHDTSTFISFNNLINWPDKIRAKQPSLPEEQRLQPRQFPLTCTPAIMEELEEAWEGGTPIQAAFKFRD